MSNSDGDICAVLQKAVDELAEKVVKVDVHRNFLPIY